MSIVTVTGVHASRRRPEWPMVTGIGSRAGGSSSTTRTEDSLFVSRTFAVVSGVAALGVLLASCGDAPTTVTGSETASPIAATGIVLSTALDAPTRDRYERALANLGAQTVTADAVVAGQGVIAVGLPVSGADAIVTMDRDAAGRMLARRLARCLEAVGVVAGPVVVDAALPSAQQEIDERGYESLISADPFDVVYNAREGDVVGAVASSAVAAESAIRVLDQNAQAVKVPVVSAGVDDATTTNLEDGALCGAVRPSFKAEARAAVDLAAGLAAGDDVQSRATQRLDVDGNSVPAILVRPSLVTRGSAED